MRFEYTCHPGQVTDSRKRKLTLCRGSAGECKTVGRAHDKSWVTKAKMTGKRGAAASEPRKNA